MSGTFYSHINNHITKYNITDKLLSYDPFIEWECDKCGGKYTRHYLSVNRKIPCPECAKKMSGSDRIKEELMPFIPEGYKFVSIEGANCCIRHNCGEIISRRIPIVLNRPSLKCPACGDHVGEEREQSCGLIAKIIEYRNRYDIDIKFNDGSKIYHKAYREFLKGTLHPPKRKKKRRKKQC